MKFTRARGVGALGIVIMIILLFAVNNSLAKKLETNPKTREGTAITSVWGYSSTLNIPKPKAPPSEPPVLAIKLPTFATIMTIAAIMIVLGGLLFIRNPERRGIAAYMSSVIGLSFFIILIWAVNNNRVDFADTLARMIRVATPLILGALAGIVCERSGVVNIGIEGMMLAAACFGYTAAIVFGRLFDMAGQTPVWIGVIAAMITGGLMAALHAWLSIRFKVDQIISGTVINILAVGLTGYVRSNFIIKYQSPVRTGLSNSPIPLLSDIPFLGPIFFNHKPITYITLLLVVVMHVMLFKTVWGLRTRAIGEHPKAADTVGINVNRMRFRNVVIGGLIAGLGGAWFSMEGTFGFDDLMTNGQGFIALAAMIFGKWTPIGAFTGALLFSAADALQIKVQNYSFDMPPQFLQMLPYIVTIIVLAGVIGRAHPPAAVGKPYEK